LKDFESQSESRDVSEKFANEVNIPKNFRKLIRGYWQLDKQLFEVQFLF